MWRGIMEDSFIVLSADTAGHELFDRWGDKKLGVTRGLGSVELKDD